MGGLITQLLLDRGLGRAGVAIEPSKPRGVLRAPLSMVRSAWPWLRDPRNRRKAVPISQAHFHYVFANTISRADSDRLHAELAIPAPGGGDLRRVHRRSQTEVEGGKCDRLSRTPTARRCC